MPSIVNDWYAGEEAGKKAEVEDWVLHANVGRGTTISLFEAAASSQPTMKLMLPDPTAAVAFRKSGPHIQPVSGTQLGPFLMACLCPNLRRTSFALHSEDCILCHHVQAEV